MLTFYDSQNNPYVLGEQIGRGGEGAVFSCEDLSIVAKIYHEPIEEEKAEKLRWMAKNKDEHLLKVAAWVIDVLHDQPNGKVVGFLMPNVRAKEIHELYSLKSRRVYFPEATWHFLVHTSANVARAFYSLHKHSHVMGDVNHGNCVVLADGTVKMIDCDSYSIKTDKMRYRCDVGVATHLAPELQNVDLSEIEREANHDNFGLAVIIFQLLFLGRHPFSGNYLGAEDKSLEECIAEHRFAYGETAEFKKVKQPPGTLSLSQVSPRIAVLFERAFSTSNKNRPEPREWVEALEDLSDNLEQCSFHPGHHYFNALANCPWCDIESQTGVMLFPFISSVKTGDGEQQFNIFTIENLISNLGISTNLPAKPPKPEILPMPSAGIIEAQKTNQNWQYAIIGAHFVILTILMAIFGVGVSCFLGFLLMAVFITVLNNTDKNLRNEINDRLTNAQQEWERIENEWNNILTPKKFNEDLSQIKFQISRYQNLQKTSVQQLKAFDEKNRHQTFENYVRLLKLSDANISDLDPVHINALEDYGIKTAADLKEENLDQVFILHKKVKENLLEWRDDLEKSFQAKVKAENSDIKKNEFTQTVSQKRRVIERDIETLFASLRSGSLVLRQRQQQIVGKSEKTAHELVQAESDMEVIGSNSFAVLALLLITFVMPFIGILLSEVNSPRVYNPPGFESKQKQPPPVAAPPLPKGEYTSEGIKRADIPDENISDNEIVQMDYSVRKDYFEKLIRQANYYRYEEIDLSMAERKLRFAVRMITRDAAALNDLGQVLYEQDKFADSLEYLKRAETLNEKNVSTKLYIGMNYLNLEKFADARDILKQITNGDSSSFEAFYNLGLAYRGLKNYSSAVVNFRQASKINPDDADAHYQLGYCFYKLGNIEATEEQYRILLYKDKELALKLYDTANLKRFYEENPSKKIPVTS